MWTRALILAASVSVFALTSAPSVAQTSSTYSVPKLSWGVPDLTGTWADASVTVLQRPKGVNNLVLTPDEALALENGNYHNVRAKKEVEEPKVDLSTGALEKGGVLPIGNYSPAYIDAGTKVGVVRGELRSSWIVDPPNGQIPFSDAGKTLMSTWRPIAFRDGGYKLPPGAKPLSDDVKQRGNSGYDGPESRGVAERCIIGLGGAGGPVMLSVLYNSHRQIVQTPTHVMIDVEMNHDARIIPIVASEAEAEKQIAASMDRWLGNSFGWYEGDSLIVLTGKVNRQQTGPVFLTDTGRVTERFTRTSASEYLYEFTVDDPRIYTQVWKGEIPVREKKEPLYEYACHEGNYGLFNILSGARENERTGKALAITKGEEG